MESSDVRIEFLSAMAGALSRYGETTDGIEGPLSRCATVLGVPATFLTLPAAVVVSFGNGAGVRTSLIRTGDSNIDLQCLDLLDGTLRDVTEGRKSAGQGLAEVRLITTRPLQFPWYVRVLASGLSGATMTVFLGGGLREIAAAVPVGLAVGSLGIWVRGARPRSVLLELLSGLLAAVLALTLGHVLPPFHLALVILAGVVMLLPGLRLTIGVSELASGRLVAGAARLAGAAIALVSLSFGVALGYAVFVRFAWMPPAGPPRDAAGPLLIAVAVLGSSLSLTVATNSRPRDILVILAAVFVAAYGARFGAWLIGPTVGVIVAALLVGLGSNAWARATSRPAAIPLVPGLAVLVPGALGFRGVSAFLRTSTGGVQILAAVLVIAGALVVGLLAADAALPARRQAPQ